MGRSAGCGQCQADPSLGNLDVVVSTPLAITEDEYIATGLLDAIRPKWALYIGGMGAKGRNFYHDLVCRYGFKAEAETVQDPRPPP